MKGEGVIYKTVVVLRKTVQEKKASGTSMDG
jgi:hypothetical protein